MPQEILKEGQGNENRRTGLRKYLNQHCETHLPIHSLNLNSSVDRKGNPYCQNPHWHPHCIHRSLLEVHECCHHFHNLGIEESILEIRNEADDVWGFHCDEGDAEDEEGAEEVCGEAVDEASEVSDAMVRNDVDNVGRDSREEVVLVLGTQGAMEVSLAMVDAMYGNGGACSRDNIFCH